MAHFPKFSIATKLYAILSLLATATVVLALVAVVNAGRHAALTGEYEAAAKGVRNVERINGLIYAARLESRGIFMSVDEVASRKFTANLVEHSSSIGRVLADWRQIVGPEDAASFDALDGQVKKYQEFVREVVRHADDYGLKLNSNLADMETDEILRAGLNKAIDVFDRVYQQRARETYAKIDSGIALTAWLMTVLSVPAVLLAVFGVWCLRRGVVLPLAGITRVTEQVAEGAAVAIPYGARHDEIGALSRSISVFQRAMRNNQELNQTVSQEAEERGARQELLSAETAAFTALIERNITQLGAISDQMMESAAQLTEASDRAAQRTEGATTASAEASDNVRDIASATDELAASVMEIDRQVAQSNAIAEKAVGEAERTNAAVQELSEAAKRIGDVVSLITDIAEQTNLLALNATIEAARAGDAGRGFAVVAGEVKALAGQTAKATEDIAEQIAGMQHATSRSIEAIEAIERTIRDIGSISSAIAAAVTEQGAATQEIARSVDVAAKRTLETAQEVSRVGDATDNTRANVKTVRSVAEELGTVARGIRDQIKEFSRNLRAA